VFNTIFHSALPSGKGRSILSSVINSNSYFMSKFYIRPLFILIILQILFFFSNNLAAQSRKKQILMLTSQGDSMQKKISEYLFELDSLQLLLSENKRQSELSSIRWNKELVEIRNESNAWKDLVALYSGQKDSILNLLENCGKKSKSDSTRLLNRISQQEILLGDYSYRLDQALEEKNIANSVINLLKGRIDSLNDNISSIYGNLITVDTALSVWDGIFCENHGDHKLEVDRALLIMNNQNLPNEAGQNFFPGDVIPLGWTSLGVFYYLTVYGNSGKSAGDYTLESFNINSGLTMSLFSFELGADVNPYENCGNLISFKEKWEQLALSNDIFPISQLSMRYSKVSCTPFYINGIKVSVTNSDCTDPDQVCLGSVSYQIGEDWSSPSEVLREFKLKKIPNGMGIDCFESIDINGYFYNPINPSNPILHVKVYEPCGYEAEVYTREYFVVLPLKGN